MVRIEYQINVGRNVVFVATTTHRTNIHTTLLMVKTFMQITGMELHTVETTARHLAVEDH